MKILIGIVMLLAFASSSHIEQPECNTYYLPDPMNIQGSAQTSLEPEYVVIDFSIETLHKLAGDSLQKNANIVSDVKEILTQKLGVIQKEISTSGLNVYPKYDNIYNKNTQQYTKVFEGYQVVNQLHVRTKSINNAGKIIDAAIKSGVDRVNSVTFDASEQKKKEAKDKLIVSAVKDAENRAKLALDALNYEITGVKSVSLDNSGVYYEPAPMYKTARAQSDSMENASTELFSSDINVKATVNVSYIIAKKQ